MRTRFGALVAMVVMTVAGSAGSARGATANVIDVFPGPNAIQNAVNAANGGDVLNIHTGTYNEDVVVNKANLTLRRASTDQPKPIVDAGCVSSTTIDVTADGVTIDGLRVQGGSFYEIDTSFNASGKVLNTRVLDTCDAEYGVNVYGSQQIAVEFVTASGFSDAGLYVGGISSTGGGILKVRRNTVTGNTKGIIMEQIDLDTDVRVVANYVYANETRGIWLHDGDGLLVRGNKVKNNGTAGIEMTGPGSPLGSSDDNEIRDNSSKGHTYDLRNLGSGNCFANNVYVTSQGPLPPC